jgi:hypothetical protein
MTGHVIVSNGAGSGAGDGGVEGGASTVTTDAHDAFCWTVSTALQAKDDCPTEKREPDAGEHVVVIGAAPPLTVGVSVTGIAFPSADVSTGDGHDIVRAGGVKGICAASSMEGAPGDPVWSYDCTTK